MGLRFGRKLTDALTGPFEAVAWKRVLAYKDDKDGNRLFEQEVEVPEAWSQRAANVVAEKFLHGALGTPERESSVRQLVGRVTSTIRDAGLERGVFETDEDADIFADELAALCLGQFGSFNSPVWFNVGVRSEGSENWCIAGDFPVGPAARRVRPGEHRPQGSACFIQSVSDDMGSIMDLARSEAMLFKRGSGTGTDLSALRSSKEKLSGGGRPSGPISFLRVYDRVASIVKSGGKTRRAAKMNTLKVNHPDIVEFVDCKMLEERKARALIAAGYDPDFNGDAYDTVAYQNANLSVRVTDLFMAIAGESHGEEWKCDAVTTGERIGSGVTASELLDRIAAATWDCGDPGVQYEDAIQAWHTTPHGIDGVARSTPINSSNPCSEYMSVDDSACNLASLNLVKYVDASGRFDIDLFRHAVRVFLVAQEILVDLGSYPTAKVALNANAYRQLGLGFANLGSLIMSRGLPYDSAEARELAGAITSLLGGEAYRVSAEMAAELGPFRAFAANREPMLGVIDRHGECASRAFHDAAGGSEAERIALAGLQSWRVARRAGGDHGFRNAQVTVLAPTGTIAFMMDCDTTGIEPAIALVAYKHLAGGGMMKIVNRTVGAALEALGYAIDDEDESVGRRSEVSEILAYIGEHDKIEGCPGLREEHLPAFDCAFPPPGGGRSISWRGHLEMMAACQPFLSGAISKTVNMPREATVAEIREAYVLAWRLGLKAVAIYRDGSKGSQPLSTSRDGGAAAGADEVAALKAEVIGLREGSRPSGPARVRPTRNDPRRVKFRVAGNEGYLHIGTDDDGIIREFFVTTEKHGDTDGGYLNLIAQLGSVALQHGAGLEKVAGMLADCGVPPYGPTGDPEVPFCGSIPNYIGKKLLAMFPGGGPRPPAGPPAPPSVGGNSDHAAPVVEAPPVPAPTGRRCCGCERPLVGGGCVTCPACGTSNGACGG